MTRWKGASPPRQNKPGTLCPSVSSAVPSTALQRRRQPGFRGQRWGGPAPYMAGCIWGPWGPFLCTPPPPRERQERCCFAMDPGAGRAPRGGPGGQSSGGLFRFLSCRTGSPPHPDTIAPAPPAGSTSLGAVIGIVVLAVLVGGLLGLLLYYRHWQKQKERQQLAVAYTAGRTGSLEYAVPGEGEGWPGSSKAQRTTCGEEDHAPCGAHPPLLPPGPRGERPRSACPPMVPVCLPACLDLPPCYTHYYSNPSYHTLSPCIPSQPAPGAPQHPSSSKVRLLPPARAWQCHCWLGRWVSSVSHGCLDEDCPLQSGGRACLGVMLPPPPPDLSVAQQPALLQPQEP